MVVDLDDFVLPLDWRGGAAADDESWDDIVAAAASVLLRWSQRAAALLAILCFAGKGKREAAFRHVFDFNHSRLFITHFSCKYTIMLPGTID